METSLIEQLDKSRYNLLKWCTIGWGIWFGTFILKDIINSPTIIGAVTWLGLLGWVIFSINLIKFLKLRRELRWNNKMKEALDDELHQLNVFKSLVFGYAIVIAVTAVFFGLTQFIVISSKLVTEVILYFGVLAALISGLIYNRD
ncbi:MAG TPA: hypothetical protein VGK10_00510 [Prolixibacteraceae bacterium]|jgi:hypothetical protein